MRKSKGNQLTNLATLNVNNENNNVAQTDAGDSPPYINKLSLACGDINVFQRESDIRKDSLDHDTLQKYGMKGAEEHSPSWCDSQIKQYGESEFHFEPNSACKKTAVFQSTKMADYQPKETLHKNSTASLGQLSRIEKEGSSTYINDSQFNQ